MECNQIVEKYLNGLKNVLSIESTDSGCILYFPFLDPSNDPIMIFVEKNGDKFRISDMAQANEYLFLHGLDIKPNTKAEWYYNDVVKRFGINSDNNELFVEVEEQNITDAVNKILTAINSIDHIIYTLSPRELPNFQDEVVKWLTDEKIIFKQKIEIYRGVTEPFKIDFEIQRRAKPQIFMQALHATIKQSAKNLAFKWDFYWNDMIDAGYKFDSVALLDDTIEDHVWEAAIPILKKKTKHVIFWEERADLLPILA